LHDVIQHPQAHCPVFHSKAVQLDEPQFNGTLLELSTMGRLAGEQEPNYKLVLPTHHPSMAVQVPSGCTHSHPCAHCKLKVTEISIFKILEME
jgi:hypothetical protein